jgi:hypothetical protein
MDQPQQRFHVVLQGRRVGPYDRRTIIGMRIRKALASTDVLVDGQGAELTVADLIGRRPPKSFDPQRTGNFSVVRATLTGSLVAVRGKGLAVPRFRGELELRVQSDVLRIAGRFRRRLGWREDRIKIPLQDIAHLRVRGSEVDLGLRGAPGQPPQELVLELFTPESAAELAGFLPAATPFPPGGSLPAATLGTAFQGLWIALATSVLVLAAVFTVLLVRRWN